MNKQFFLNIANMLILASTLAVSSSYALTPNIQNSIEQIDPGRTAEELTPNPEAEPVLPNPVIKAPKPKTTALPKGANNITFMLKDITIIGNTVFTNQQLHKIYQEKLNKKITTTELQDIANTITLFYRDQGYILTQVIIPPQEIDSKGIAKLQIIEGYISNIIIQGSKTKNINRLLEQYGHRIQKSRPLNAKILERYSLLANDIPGAIVKTIISSSESTRGAADLTFIVEDKTINWGIGANNYNAPVLGPIQINASAYVNNATIGSQTGISSVVSGSDSRLIYLALQHRQAVNDNGLNWDYSFSNTKTKPDLTKIGLEDLYIPGEAFLFVTNMRYPIIRSRKENLFINGGFKLLNSHSDYYSGYLSKDYVRSINASIIYDFTSQYGSSNTAIVTISQGLNILGAMANPPTRIGGRTDFTKLDIFLDTKQQLLKRPVYLYIAFKGQYAFSQLLSSETFGYGGIPFGYGYDQSAITGDQGIAAHAEIQYQYKLFQIFGFCDGGKVWNINHTYQTPSQSAGSLGAGLRAQIEKNLSIELAIADPLNKNINSANNTNIKLLFNAQLWF